MLKFFAKLRCPVLRPNFIAVDRQRLEGFSRKRSHVLHDFPDDVIEVLIQSRPIHLIHFETRTCSLGTSVTAAVRTITEAEDRPVTLRHVPCQMSVMRHLCRQVNHSTLWIGRPFRNRFIPGWSESSSLE